MTVILIFTFVTVGVEVTAEMGTNADILTISLAGDVAGVCACGTAKGVRQEEVHSLGSAGLLHFEPLRWI